jgi:hypothetical protein
MIPKIQHITTCFLILFFGCVMNGFAQKVHQNLQYEDLKPYHFGFSVGFNQQDLIPTHTGTPDTDGNQWYGSVNRFEPGFSVGVLADLRLLDKFSLRSTPSIHFGSKVLTLYSTTPGLQPVESIIRSNYVLVPINLRYRAHRTNNYRPYLLGGLSAGIDMGRNKLEPIVLKPANVYLEIGVGMDLYMSQYKLVPELKLCLGLMDNLEHTREEVTSKAYEQSFEKITSRLIVFSLYFE